MFLITGGAGFIGSHLADALMAGGQQVVALDDLSTGSAQNVAHLEKHPNYHLVRGSTADRQTIERLAKGANAIFHLAASVGVRRIVERPIETINNNVDGTNIVLEVAAELNIPLLVASTSEVYGKLNKHMFGEEDDLVLGPTSKSRWAYAASKIIDEFLAKAYWAERGLPVVIVRLFNTIGPRQTGQYGMVVPRFVRQALANEPLTVYGDGSQQRSFTWVGDVVEAMIALVGNEAAYGQVFNIGHYQETAILELAETVKRMTGSSSPISLIPFEEAFQSGFEDMPRRLPDISKLAALTGYSPSLNLEEMLREIIDYERTPIEVSTND